MPITTSVYISGVGTVDMWLQNAQPAKTLMHFANTAVDTLQSVTYNVLPNAMWGSGWNVVSFDLPGHGTNLNPGEPYVNISDGLTNWVTRAKANENITATFNAQVSLVVDWLIVNGKGHAGKIAISGISRGGFVTTHALGAVYGIAAAVGLIPVMDLAVLFEFSGALNNWIVKQTALGVSFCSTKPIYIESSNSDTRVNTAEAIHNVGKILNRMLTTNQVEFHITRGPGHAIPVGAESRAASWLNERMI